MIGTQILTLSHESVREALEEYVNRHLKAEHATHIDSWQLQPDPNNYGGNHRNVEVTIAPPKGLGPPSELPQTPDAK